MAETTYRPSYPWGPGAGWGRKLLTTGWRPGMYGLGATEETGFTTPGFDPRDGVWGGAGQFNRPNPFEAAFDGNAGFPSHPGSPARWGQFSHGFTLPGYMAREPDERPTHGPMSFTTGRPTPIYPSMGEDAPPFVPRTDVSLRPLVAGLLVAGSIAAIVTLLVQLARGLNESRRMDY